MSNATPSLHRPTTSSRVPSPTVGTTSRKPKPKLPKRRRSCCRSCCICCGWMTLVLFIFLLLLAVCIAVIMAWYRPKMPEFRIERLKVSKFDIKESSNLMSTLEANVDLSIRVLNKNDKVWFLYGEMAVEAATEYVGLGHASLPGFSQGMKNATVVPVHMKVTGVQVGELSGKKLREKFEANALVVDVDVSGKMSVVIGDRHTPAIPMSLTCYGMNQGKVASGLEPRCTIYLFGAFPVGSVTP